MDTRWVWRGSGRGTAADATTTARQVNIVSMDKLHRDDQIRLAARTTIMLGVHGNGLTHLLWMKPTPRATVIEFFFPQGFAHDYEFTVGTDGDVRRRRGAETRRFDSRVHSASPTMASGAASEWLAAGKAAVGLGS